MLRKLYHWTLSRAAHKNAHGMLVGVSFTESIFFPIPPDILLIPMVLAHRKKAWIYALTCTLASVFGAVCSYAIGYFFHDLIGKPIIDLYNGGAAFTKFADFYTAWGAWIILGAAVSMLPYKIATIASGVFQLNLPLFIIAGLIGRGARFFLIAGLIYYFGDPIKNIIDKYFNLIMTIFICLLLGGFLIITLI